VGFFAVFLASINIFGGFVVTNRMLAMFKKKEVTSMTQVPLSLSNDVFAGLYLVATIFFILGLKVKLT